MKIVHISDIHIRNLKYHDSYKRAFEDLYKHLDEIKPDLVINTGDTAHTKVQISPEFVEMCSEHIRRVSEYAPYHILLGNHDLNLVNLNRQDAITPIVDSIGNSTKHPVFLHKKSGVKNISVGGKDVSLYVFSCADEANYPDIKEEVDDSRINIGLYHGAIRSAVTDTDWELDADDDASIFDGLDYTLLGDIHQHQFIDQDGRIAYAGSLIQQNFGEKPDKGFLLWEIYDKDEWDVEHIKLKGSRRFFTVNLGEGFSIPEKEIEPGARIRITTEKQFTLAEQQRFEKLVKQKFDTEDIITVPPQNIGKQVTESVTGSKVKIGNLRDTDIQEKLIGEFLKDRELSEEVMSKIFELNKKFQVLIEKDEDIIRDVFWKIKTLGWSNMFNYGEDNIIDFSKIKGISGLFAQNSAGKSSLIDTILESLFDKTTTGVSKNMFLVNDNKKIGKMIAEIETADDQYTIERKIEKIKYGKRKLEEEREWGKTSTNFISTDDDGNELESFNGQSRPETEKNIRRHLGTYDDFVMTSLLAQSRDTDIIKCKETDRKKILYKFMDLDVFDSKFKLAKEYGRPSFQRLKDFDKGNLEAIYFSESTSYEILKDELETLKLNKAEKEKSVKLIEKMLSDSYEAKVSVGDDLHLGTIETQIDRTNKEGLEALRLLSESKQEEESLTTMIEALENKLKGIDPNELKRALKACDELQGELNSNEAQLARERSQLDRWNKELSILEEVPCGTSFPKCKFLTNAFDKKGALPKQLDKVDDLTENISFLEDQITDANRPRLIIFQEAYDSHCNKVKTAKSKLAQSKLSGENSTLKIRSSFEKAIRFHAKRDQCKKNAAAIEKNEELDKTIADCKVTLKSKAAALKEVNREMMSITKNIGSKESVVEHLAKEIEDMKDLRVLCDAYEHYSDAMGKHGIAHQILVEKLPLINDEINKILSSVANFSVFIDHDQNENSIRLYLQYGSYVGRRLELAGGAEKLLASIAIRTALLSITNLPKSNMFIIDEGFGSLDPGNLDNINRMFDYLRSVFDHVLIVSHIDAMKDIVDNNIEISVDAEGYSHIEVI